MIILTGGAGFIGSCILQQLNEAGQEDILIVDSLGTGEKWKNVAGKTFIDIVSKEEFREQMMVDDVDQVSAVIHMGACSATTERDADYLFDNNYRYSTEIAAFALQRGARFVYASSAATYGNGSRGYTDTERTLQPLNMYGYSKHLFDQWIWSQGLDTQCVGLKFFNVFGPNEYHKGEQASMVYKAFHQIEDAGRVKLFKSNDPAFDDGGQKRDFVYVKDVARIVVGLLENQSINGVLNLGSGVARTWNDLVHAAFTAMGRTPSIEYVEMPDSLKGQYQNFTEADMSAFKAVLPEATFMSLEDSIADYVNNHLQKEWSFL